MRLKSNSPTQPSGDDEGDGDAGVPTWDGTLRITSGWRNFDFLGRDGFPRSPRASFVYLILNHDEATLTTPRRLSRRNSFLQFHAESMRENAPLPNLLLLSSLSRSSFAVIFRSFGAAIIPRNFIVLKNLTTAAIRNWNTMLIKYYAIKVFFFYSTKRTLIFQYLLWKRIVNFRLMKKFWAKGKYNDFPRHFRKKHAATVII